MMVTEREIKDWYDQRHLSFGEEAWRPFEAYPIFLDYLGVKAGRKLLDIGCGTGYLLKAATQKGLQTYGVDISEEGVKIAQKVSSDSQIVTGRGEDLKFPDDFFDYITCLGALEHFIDMENGVKEMVRVAKKEAPFCIVVPNINFLFWKIKASKGTAQQDINENLLPLKQWKDMFIKHGLEVVKIYREKWFLKKINTRSSINLLDILKRTIYKLAWFFVPLNYTYQFVFILKKR